MMDPENGLNGSNFIILVNTGTDEVPVFEAVGCQRGMTIDENTAAIDTSCKGNRAQRVIPGRYTATLSGDGLYVPDDAAYLRLKQANRLGQRVQVAREDLGVVTEMATAVITGMSSSFPDQDVATISISLTLDGGWVEVGS